MILLIIERPWFVQGTMVSVQAGECTGYGTPIQLMGRGWSSELLSGSGTVRRLIGTRGDWAARDGQRGRVGRHIADDSWSDAGGAFGSRDKRRVGYNKERIRISTAWDDGSGDVIAEHEYLGGEG